jgi:hypothetical protein
MSILAHRSEEKLELLATPIYPSAGRDARGETIELLVPAPLFNSADGIWRLGRMLGALLARPARP